MSFSPAEYEEMWNKILHVFPILDESDSLQDCPESEFDEVVQILITLKIESMTEKLVFNKIEERMRQNVAPNFWKYFTESEDELSHFNQFNDAIAELYQTVTSYVSLIEKLDKLRAVSGITECLYGEDSIVNSFKLLLRASLLAQLPPHHQRTIESFYEVSFKIFCNPEDDSNVESKCINNCEDECQCPKIMELFYDTNRRLVELSLLEPLVGQVLTSLIQIRIENYVQQICKGSFDVSYIESLENWLSSVVILWLDKIYCVQGEGRSDSMSQFQQRLLHFLYETYTKTRIGQLFNIIIEYPDSLPAIEDLHACLPKTDLRPYLIGRLQRALETRLLHPGVNTPDILTAYIATIRSLRVLDPSGALLDIITQPVHRYLRSREDTVRCVVSSLTEEGSNELADELVKGEALHLDEHCPEDEDADYWENWNPDPVELEPSKLPQGRRSLDIISMLVSVYGSKELFVNEYRTLLADRLLSQNPCNATKEFRYLELLKLRFGETQLHYCEVMLKDVWNSRKINQLLQSDADYRAESGGFPVSAMILSAQFWPAFKDETLELPPLVRDQFGAYTRAFEHLKGNRTLHWKPHLGSVELEVELKDRTLGLTVSPVHACLLMHFERRDRWTLDELSQQLQAPATFLRKKISFWQSQGVVREAAPDVFLLVEESAAKSRGPPAPDIVCEDDEAESAMASSQDQREEELQVFWSYIIGMLTNLDSMPLARIHQMLKMFASQGPTAVECTQQELRQFLDRKVREHKLLFSGGYYRLPKT